MGKEDLAWQSWVATAGKLLYGHMHAIINALTVASSFIQYMSQRKSESVTEEMSSFSIRFPLSLPLDTRGEQHTRYYLCPIVRLLSLLQPNMSIVAAPLRMHEEKMLPINPFPV